MFKYKVIFFVILTSPCVLGQSLFKKVKYEAESGVYLSNSGKTPFWLRSNQYGVVPLENPIFILRGAIHKEYDSTYNTYNKLNKYSFGYGINSIVNVGKINQVHLLEAYFKTRYGAFELYAGRRKEVVGSVDTVLTSGAYIWSGNALPLPKIQISIPNYTPILGNGLLSIKGAFSHGWFDNGFVQNFYFHQKYLYARIGKPNWKIKLHSGFNHQVQWGGRPIKPYFDSMAGVLITKYSSDLAAYLKVVSGVSLNKNADGLQTGAPLNEAWNRAGNHLGTIDISIEANLNSLDVLLYRQSIYDDGSLFFLNNISDGLLGISVNRNTARNGISKITFEYLDTRSQGGETGSESDISQLRGRDNYFNNTTYLNGWTYLGKTIGSPLLAPINSIRPEVASKYYSKFYPKSYVLNNRVQAYYLAIKGRIMKNIDFMTKVSISKNLGTYQMPISVTQYSSYHQFTFRLKRNYLINSIFAIDKGELFGNNLGVSLSVQRTFF